MALKMRFEVEPSRHREPLQGELEIEALLNGPELRSMALGSFYSPLTLTDSQLAEVEDELRKGRMYEVLSMTTTMRRLEIDELRRQHLEKEASLVEEKHRGAVHTQLLRQKALAALQREAEYTKLHEEHRLTDDRRLLLQREKEALMDRRRRFETEYSGVGASDTSVSHASRYGAHAEPPVLVMNVVLGNGREDRIIVRMSDNPRQVAADFARKHHLPESSLSNLVNQIKSNLAAARQKSAAGGSSNERGDSALASLLHTPPSGQRISTSRFGSRMSPA